MKFMKLGSKPDVFQADGNQTRYASSELATDFVVNVGEVKFYLHKFPLLSKCDRLHALVLKFDGKSDEIELLNFPGGPKAFEICAKFCYGITVTLNAYNVLSARCAAEYLEMTEELDKGNLIVKIEAFLNTSIFCSWKDSIIVLQTTKSFIPWSEDLNVTCRCTDSIASKISADPANINWSYTCNRKLAFEITTRKFRAKSETVPKDWWVEDTCELDIDLYKRVVLAVKSDGKMDVNVLCKALKIYAMRWLPDSIESLVSHDHAWKYKIIAETIICLLPCCDGCSCRFLLKLLKACVLVGADESAREDLVTRIGLKLDEASVNDLLIPTRFPDATFYDINLVRSLVSRFYLHEKSSVELGSVGKLIDGYLFEVASDPNLRLSDFVSLSKLAQESARPIHDSLYNAIDMFLKEHPSMTKAERKSICMVMDVKRLTMKASLHAAQNERLPLRVVVQVLYFQQVRARITNSTSQNATHEKSESFRFLTRQSSQAKITGDEFNADVNSRVKLLACRSRRIFGKFWLGGRVQVENKNSERLSSQNPILMNPREAKFSRSSRNRRHSVS